MTETRDDQVRRVFASNAAMTEEVFARELEAAEQRGAVAALAAEYLTIIEAAAVLKCCRESIYNYIKAGKLPYITSVSGRRLIRASDLVQLSTVAA